jgi:hypothetical protein
LIENLTRSVKYVSGEIYDNILPHKGSSPIGMNMPLINTIGNFITVEIIFILAGGPEGGVDIKEPGDEKQKEASRIPGIKKYSDLIEIPLIIPTDTGITVIIIPNKKDARISPSIIADMRIGEETSLSRVLVLVSHGAMSGTMTADVKKGLLQSGRVEDPRLIDFYLFQKPEKGK